MLDAGGNVAFGQFGKIEAGAEMLAVAGEHRGADAVGDRGEEFFNARDSGVVKRVAFFRSRQRQDRDCAVPFRAQRRRQSGKFRGCGGFGHAYPAVAAAI